MTRDSYKARFVILHLDKNPDATFESVALAWSLAGHPGGISRSTFDRARARLAIAKIRPCPFCHNTEAVVATRNPDGQSHVECPMCEARGPVSTSIEVAVRRWNDAVPWPVVRTD
jgi:hypothetical protein